jgi:hypothetical protein
MFSLGAFFWLAMSQHNATRYSAFSVGYSEYTNMFTQGQMTLPSHGSCFGYSVLIFATDIHKKYMIEKSYDAGLSWTKCFEYDKSNMVIHNEPLLRGKAIPVYRVRESL